MLFFSQEKSRGFTLLEILLSVALIGLLAGLSIPIYQSFQVRNDLDIATGEVVQTARRAQTLAQGVAGDAPWGIYLQSDSLTLFQGTSYAARNNTWDEIFSLPATIIPSGLQEIVFSKFSGEPQTNGAIILTSSNNETRTISINSQGTANY
jgi:prepilin-type N-terminal cleavage/methylation domain-containing protein